MTAKLINKSGNKQIYELNPPFVEKNFSNKIVAEHSIVAVITENVVFEGSHTKIIPCMKHGFITGFRFIDTVYSNTRRHKKALKDIGYDVV